VIIYLEYLGNNWVNFLDRGQKGVEWAFERGERWIWGKCTKSVPRGNERKNEKYTNMG
jgi:hypothetical protein